MSHADDLYVGARTNSVRYTDMTVTRLFDRMLRATTALEDWEAVEMQEDDVRNTAGPALPCGAVADVAKAYAALVDIHRLIPAVMGWGVGYLWGRDKGSWSCWTAHESVAEASDFRDAWEAKAQDKGRRERRRGTDEWIVRFSPCQVTKFVKPGTDAVAYVNESGAFN